MSTPAENLAARFNRDCSCQLLDVPALRGQLDSSIGLAVSPQLFSSLAVFLDERQAAAMRDIVAVVSRTVSLPGYQQHVLAGASEIARYDPRIPGLFPCFDFHLAADGPQLIEINTNAGGAFLNLAALGHQRICCPTPRCLQDPPTAASLEDGIHSMFLDEWRGARGAQRLQTIAIVDERPEQQFLYPEFLLARDFLEARGIRVSICDPSELSVCDEELRARGETVDMVYNRLTDFYFDDPRHQVLRDAFMRDLTVITPHPRAHALWADKGNLALLGDPDFLRALAVSPADIDILVRGIPRTVRVGGPPEQWWQDRKRWFFKPRRAFGSRGTYRGDKLTRRAFGDVIAGDYIAQRFAAPGERGAGTDGAFKYDVRCYAYGARVQLMAARLYQGQTTNFRTPGGGFAPVYVVGTG